MMGKILFLAGAATGYVLGSKAGRQAYEQIKGKAQDLWGDPNVQKVVSQAGQAAKDAATVAQSKISGAAKEAKSSTSGDETPDVSTTTAGTVAGTTAGSDLGEGAVYEEETPVVPPASFGAPATPGSVGNPPV